MDEKSNAELALNAMRRASRQVLERAANKGLKIPIWKEEKIIFVDPKDIIEQNYCHEDSDNINFKEVLAEKDF
jgi:hypothetical protein